MSSLWKEVDAAAAAAETEFDLETVKQITQQVEYLGPEDTYAPIYQWRLLINDQQNLQPTTTYSSDLFPINNCYWFGQLKLTYSANNCKISLALTDSDNDDRIVNKLTPLQFFVCMIKYKTWVGYDVPDNICLSSMNAFNLNGADENELNFNFCFSNVTNLIVELHQEPIVLIEYRSPYKNMVVGKIEQFNAMMTKANFDDILSVSPRINFGSSDQLIIVKFCCSKLQNTSTTNASASGLSATLHFVSTSESVIIQPFYFTATFTIFSQNKSEKDLVYNAVYRRDENKSHFFAFLASSYELSYQYSYLADDNLYYKVVIEPYPLK